MRWLVLCTGILLCAAQGRADRTVDLDAALSIGTEALARRQLGDLSRLPSYQLSVEVEPALGRFKVTEALSFVNREAQPLEDVVLFVYANAAGAVRSDGSPAIQLVSGRCVSTACAVTSEPGGILRVQLERAVAPGATIELELELAGQLPRLSDGRTSLSGQTMEALSSLLGGRTEAGDFGLLALGNGIASLGGFHAVLAPRRDGAWDAGARLPIGDLTSDDVANVAAHVRVPVGTRVATTGVVTAQRELPDGWSEYDVAAPLVRDFAVLASEFLQVSERAVGDVLVRVHLLPGSAERAERVMNAACDSLALFSKSFGTYPYRELDVVEAPLVGGVGGVEFSGLVTVAHMVLEPSREGNLSGMLEKLAGPLGGIRDLVPDRGELVDLVVGHEVAHQWWHVLVGSDSRREPFVDEGLAQWSALYFLERARGPEVAARAEKQMVTSYQTMRLMGGQDGAVEQPVEGFGSQLAYGGIVYGKGPLVYREIRRTVGHRVFSKALQGYVGKYAFRVAPRRGLVELLARGPNKERVEALAERWLAGTHGDEDLGTFGGGAAGAGLPDLGKLLGGSGDTGGALKRLQELLRGLGK
jgi:hypothetical protein